MTKVLLDTLATPPGAFLLGVIATVLFMVLVDWWVRE